MYINNMKGMSILLLGLAQVSIGQGQTPTQAPTYDEYFVKVLWENNHCLDNSQIDVFNGEQSLYDCLQFGYQYGLKTFVEHDTNLDTCTVYSTCDSMEVRSGSNIYRLKNTFAPTPSPTTSPTTSTVDVVVGSISVSVSSSNNTNTESITKQLIDDIVAEYTQTSYTIQSTDTFTLPQSALSGGASDQDLIDAIKASRNCSECTVTLGGRRRVLEESRALDATIEVEITYSLDKVAFDELVASGNTLESQEFRNALASDSGVDANTINVQIIGSEISVIITLESTSSEEQPLDETTVEQLSSLNQDAVTSVNTIIIEIGDGAATVSSVNLCASRTCSGRGVFEQGVTDANGCVLATGVCQCSGEWWGINCEISCTCVNGGVCTNSYCTCQYPYHGKRCQDTKTSDCETC